MNPEFFQVGLVIIAFAHVVAVDIRGRNERGENVATVQLSNGNSYSFEGDEAAALALAFAAHEQAIVADAPTKPVAE